MRSPTIANTHIRKQSSALRTAKFKLENNFSPEIEVCDNTLAVLHMLFPHTSNNKNSIIAFFKEDKSVAYIYTYTNGQKMLCFCAPALPYMDNIIAAVEALEDEGGG